MEHSPSQAQHRCGFLRACLACETSPFTALGNLKILEGQLHDCALLRVCLVVAINEVNRKQSSVIFRECGAGVGGNHQHGVGQKPSFH